MHITPTDEALARALATLEGVVGVAIGGSRATGTADDQSDTDLYAFHRGPLPPSDDRHAALAALADGGRVRAEDAWGPEDHLGVDGRLVEVVYLDLDALRVDEAYDTGWLEEGFTTAFLHTVARGVLLWEATDEISALKRRLGTYPEATRSRLWDALPPLLGAYTLLVRKAAERRDWPSVVQRRASVQAVWFNLLFALNRAYHPGEKRLLLHAERCDLRVPDQSARWAAAALMRADDPDLPPALASLADDLLDLGTLHV